MVLKVRRLRVFYDRKPNTRSSSQRFFEDLTLPRRLKPLLVPCDFFGRCKGLKPDDDFVLRLTLDGRGLIDASTVLDAPRKNLGCRHADSSLYDVASASTTRSSRSGTASLAKLYTFSWPAKLVASGGPHHLGCWHGVRVKDAGFWCEKNFGRTSFMNRSFP